MEDANELSRTELDSHANMPVIGRNAYILSKIGETVDVAPFTPHYKPISVELVDAALKYECPYSGKVKILIIRRGLYVPSMTHNLLPPFMLRETGIHINEFPKIHVTSSTEEHNAITFQETNFRIPLALHGTFSYFPTSKPSTQELEEPEDVYVLTPTTWNPHSDAYVINEESMLDWEGNMKHEKEHEKRVVLEDIPSDDTMISSLALCENEQMAVSSYFVYQDEDINATYGFEDEHQLYQALNMRNEHGQFAMNIGTTSIFDQHIWMMIKIPVMMITPHWITQMMTLTQLNWMMTQTSNKAELYNGLIKEAVRNDIHESNSPLCFWDYCVERRAGINNLIAKNAFRLHGSTPHTLTTGDEGDILNLCQYGWYEWCYFRDQPAAFPNNKEVLGRVLGPARGAGNEMAQWILKVNGRVVPRRSLRPLKVDEIHSPVEVKKREVFDEIIKRRWGTPMTPQKHSAAKSFRKI